MGVTKKIAFSMVYLLIPLPIIGLMLGGLYTFLPFFILFALVPLVDAFIIDQRNPTHKEEQQLLKSNYFSLITYPYVFAQIILIAYGVYIVSNTPLSWYEWLGFTGSLGLITGGAGINLAHELMHKNNRMKHLISKTLLVTVCYGHFFIEHVKGHHVRVATPEDPATAQLGESLYHFIPKTLMGSFKSALKIERHRLQQKKYSIWSLHNQFWWIISAPLAISMTCYAYGGFVALAFFLTQSFIAIMTLEIVNYIEHYGLERKKLPHGEYEKVTPFHSWNACHWLSNMLLIHLQRHSDHHAFGARPYQILRHMAQSPQLPSGYLGMLVLALIPPLWHRVMDKRVLAHKQQLKNETRYLTQTEAILPE